jgi:hypothetical protein
MQNFLCYRKHRALSAGSGQPTAGSILGLDHLINCQLLAAGCLLINTPCATLLIEERSNDGYAGNP